ncbi:hypothetical protein GCG21_15095 [Pseudactinotalea sp. HY160]|uniref:hypothetical protein n=1 Tax=Pseudactinotalea sp. HY160 TaxID=2654490 RepID=UPI00128BACD2|nr:hypothetical protein [Pseudactinotalea sp. HY160]MPV51310.1 hypothetical protein [Pseudactinotalea sp. HY160]
MSTTDRTPLQTFLLVLIPFTGVVLLTAIGLLLREYAPGNMGTGFLVGAGLALVAAAVAGLRVVRHPERATTFERGWTQRGDERDDLVLTRALAVLGLLSLPLTVAATLLIGVGVDQLPILLALNLALMATLAISFAVINRRN